ncbi:MmcQ/YjbR family DNA-binding protein [Leuconostoc gelidum subsp. aenigmaticum]|uniref:MmcQ/YjbR family DNA-binding protein n=1 Tax=Leuconostoc gelidum TaxID=1244 RepID=UPI001C7D9E0B|nr:MmcQ/YjbR family DNA-binding protein [Leuconostoc gelidum]MBZ6003704.1 MmcQ/YjbR family DNA-binding protein [Leuconostoc gelidum subsp. aenigmaticum]MBZ6008780.1 MmcQ/YjbR family DNA-binding protein [Leuconostoc gelidum subsp. aenigmaticum]MBZ6010173.1 MmcQ/YjbR family DNA-binding protein [Leuconostoc gelidum subsp. aenigmaticum]
MINQTVSARIKHFQDFGNSLPHAKVYFRDDWKTIYFDLSGKMFGLMSPTASEKSIITLKGDPESNIELREIYPDVTAGYYANKKHWNSIKLLTSELSDQEIEKMIAYSYKLVYKNLPLSVRKAFTASD